MPTTLPPRTAPPPKPLDFAELAIPMLRLYAVIAIAIVAIVATEDHFGQSGGMTFVEEMMQATGADGPYGLIGP